jgi:RNA polymerase sigma-70 factor (ECF subfamily)
LEYSPVAALNRTYALSKANSKQEAITEAEKLQLTNNHLYYCLLGNLYNGINTVKAKEYLQHALTLAKTPADKKIISQQIARLEKG